MHGVRYFNKVRKVPHCYFPHINQKSSDKTEKNPLKRSAAISDITSFQGKFVTTIKKIYKRVVQKLIEGEKRKIQF